MVLVLANEWLSEASKRDKCCKYRIFSDKNASIGLAVKICAQSKA